MTDFNRIRDDFPMLKNHPELIYFDNGATTLKPQCVIDAVNAFYTEHTSNIHRGDYAIALENDNLYDRARKSFAELLNCDEKEIIFTYNTTASLNQVAYGLEHNFLKEGDVILTTEAEHASDLLPWFRLQKRGFKVAYVPLDSQANLTVDAFRKAMHEGVKAVCIAQVTNVLGSLQPIKEITAIAHEYGALMIVDGAQSVPHMTVDVTDLDVDFLACSAHKMCGPGGVGILYGKYDLLEKMDPLFMGGDMNARFYPDGSWLLKSSPTKFEAGTPAIENIIGAGAAAQYLMSIGPDSIHTYEKELRAYFLERISRLENIVVYNPQNVYGPIDFNVKGVFAQDAACFLATKNVAVRSGNHCAKLLHEIIGTDSTVRASLYFYNTCDEVDRFVSACGEINLENAVGIFF